MARSGANGVFLTGCYDKKATKDFSLYAAIDREETSSVFFCKASREYLH